MDAFLERLRGLTEEERGILAGEVIDRAAVRALIENGIDRVRVVRDRK